MKQARVGTGSLLLTSSSAALARVSGAVDNQTDVVAVNREGRAGSGDPPPCWLGASSQRSPLRARGRTVPPARAISWSLARGPPSGRAPARSGMHRRMQRSPPLDARLRSTTGCTTAGWNAQTLQKGDRCYVRMGRDWHAARAVRQRQPGQGADNQHLCAINGRGVIHLPL